MSAQSSRPDWLLGHLIRTGHMTETGLTRRARLRRCGTETCGMYVLAGLDGDTCAMEAFCDPRPLTPQGEANATLAGLRTYALRRAAGGFQLDPRGWHEIRHRPAGSSNRLDVLAEHKCGTRLAVESYAASSFPVTPPRQPGSTPDF